MSTNDSNRLQLRTPEFINKFKGPSGILNGIVLLLGTINIAIVGYNFSYFKGGYRENLFYAELNFLVIFCACFIGTAVNMIGNLLSPQPFATNTIHETVSSMTYGVLSALAATVLLIQLSVYGRYFVNAIEIKIFASIVGLLEALIYLVNTFILYKDAKTLV